MRLSAKAAVVLAIATASLALPQAEAGAKESMLTCGPYCVTGFECNPSTIQEICGWVCTSNNGICGPVPSCDTPSFRLTCIGDPI
jgi:hypothetical protein